MKATAISLATFALGALAIPVMPEDKSPYLMPAPILGGDKINILKPIRGSGDASPRRPPQGGYRDLKLKKDVTLAWKNGTWAIEMDLLCFFFFFLPFFRAPTANPQLLPVRR